MSNFSRARDVSCFSCQNRERSEWCTLDNHDTETLNRAKTCNTYKPGQVIFYQGNPCLGVYCVESGVIGLRKDDAQGNSVLVRMVHTGETLGYRTYFGGGEYTATAEALEPSRVCFVDRSAVQKLLEKNPALGLRFLSRLAHDLSNVEDTLFRSTTYSVRARLSHLLLSLKDRFATVDDEGKLELTLPLSRQDMAAIVGTRPETIARTIKSLEDDGVAFFSRRNVQIPDLDLLLDELEPVQ